MKIHWTGVEDLQRDLLRKSETDFLEVGNKNIRSIYSRSQKPGGTPVGNYKGGGQLRISAKYRGDEMGYSASYGPHVEYGHRTRSGSYVTGQYFLKRNVDTQRPLYKQSLIDELRK